VDHSLTRLGTPSKKDMGGSAVKKLSLIAAAAALIVATPVSARASEIEATGEALLAGHQIVATSCEQPRGFRRIHVKGGIEFARAGEVFAFEPRLIRAEPCEEIEVVFENTDAVRHALMLPGLNPMFILEFSGPKSQSLRFVTPDEDVTLNFHCHVPSHEEMGMHGQLIVGKGGEKVAERPADQEVGTQRLYAAVGVVVAVEPRKGRLIVDHEEIKDFMAPMVMSYRVTPVTLLQGLKPADKIRFTIDGNKRAIVDIVPERQ
jgi:Cu/Ag efflux protein CusF/plastocyanin